MLVFQKTRKRQPPPFFFFFSSPLPYDNGQQNDNNYKKNSHVSSWKAPTFLEIYTSVDLIFPSFTT